MTNSQLAVQLDCLLPLPDTPTCPALPCPALSCPAHPQGTSAVWWTLAQGGRWGVLPSDPAYTLLQDFATRASNFETEVACPVGNPLLAPVFPPKPNCPKG